MAADQHRYTLSYSPLAITNLFGDYPGVEKRKPTYDLESVKDAVLAGRYRMTLTARQSVYGLGMNDREVVQVVSRLRRTDFYKSMTAYKDSRVWQDVYHARWAEIMVYLKFQMDDDGYLIVSFKEK